jgi:hypothetical protein
MHAARRQFMVGKSLVSRILAEANKLGVPPLRVCAIVPAEGAPVIVPRDWVAELPDIGGVPVTSELRHLLVSTAGGACDALKIIYLEERSIAVRNVTLEPITEHFDDEDTVTPGLSTSC